MMTVRLIAHTPEPEKVVAAAAKLCYSDAHITDLLDGLTEEKTAKFLTMLSDLGHASPVEHASFTFGIEGVSRTLLAQITRHRIASFSVQSQRYVRLEDLAVDEAVRGQGVGGELLAAAKRWARNRRLEYLELNVLAQNENAIRLYESQDFVEATKVMRCML